jgi:hypothetical protein
MKERDRKAELKDLTKSVYNIEMEYVNREGCLGGRGE